MTEAPSDERDPYVGQELEGGIEIRELVGQGSMGRVYRAFQKSIDRVVAVKILHRELTANGSFVSHFMHQSQVASRLSHPNIVRVLSTGQLPNHALYTVMEYLDGVSLTHALLAAGGSMPLPRALHVTLQLCEAVGEAHAQGIVHRNLKPESVMLVRRAGEEDFVKVLDFGVARIHWAEEAATHDVIFDAARYISPEVRLGADVGPASDVYSIATLLYRMLAGRTPFEADQALRVLHDAPPKLTSLARATHVPDAISDVIMANLAKDPRDRAPDARAFAQRIRDASPRRPTLRSARLTAIVLGASLVPLVLWKTGRWDGGNIAERAANEVSSASSAYKVSLGVSVAEPQLGQTVELSARIMPADGNVSVAFFTITGPGIPNGATVPANKTKPGIFQASYAFAERGTFEIVFSTQVDHKPLQAARILVAGSVAGDTTTAPLASPLTDPTNPTDATSPVEPASPADAASPPETGAGVKWM